MRPFSLLVKPASGDCNLRCHYCFYLQTCRLYPETKTHRMSDTVLERVIHTYMETDQPVYSLCWQGGEPTLMGVDFFSRAIEFQKKHGHAGARVSNSVQTNATLITDPMAALFSEYQFLAGCSLDGPAHLHNQYRTTLDGKSTHHQVLTGIQILQQHQVQFNILTLVSQANVHQAPEVYQYLKKMGFQYQQYIPCVEFDQEGKRLPFAITGPEWGRFLCSLFDAWYPKDVFSLSVRNFDTILSQKTGRPDTVCTQSDNCCHYFVVEYNGDVYPCDFFVENRFKLGNIMENSWEQMMEGKAYQEFGAQKNQWNRSCSACNYLTLCAGDCLKNRTFAGNHPSHLSWLCPGWKHFFNHTSHGFDTLSEQLRKDQQPDSGRGPLPPKPGRNDPCVCGSGVKFKKCCGK